MKVAVIILIWNGREDTLECLRSWRDDRYADKQLIVVDNGSTDGSAEAIAREFPEVIVLRSERNLGFSGGNNIGLRYARSNGFDFALLLNNDTTVEPQALTELMSAVQAKQEVGLAAPVIHYYAEDRAVWFAASRMDLRRGEAVHDNRQPPGRDATPYDVPWLTGCALLVRMTALAALGGLDERYFLSWEDVDFSLRAAAAGWKLAVVPSARIYHKGGRATRRLLGDNRDYYDLRNRLLLIRTHLRRGYARSAALVIARCLARPLRERGRRPAARLADLRRAMHAIADHFLGHYGEQPLRGR